MSEDISFGNSSKEYVFPHELLLLVDCSSTIQTPQAEFISLSQTSSIMMELQGNWLLAAVTTLTSMGFLLIGFDNGLMGGLSTSTTRAGY
jgi:hypothetical protein